MIRRKKTAVYTGTRNLYPMMVPAVKSLLINSDVDEVWLLIEDDEFPKKYGLPDDIVKVRNVSGQKYFKPDGPNMNSKFTYMAMMRAALAYEFPELDEILALDVDTIVDKDISGIWDLPLGDEYYLAASEEPGASIYNGHFSVNIGVCLYNLRKLRDGKCDEVIEALNTRRYMYLEQDTFSELCPDAILDMPSDYNVCHFTKEYSVPRIIHYAGMKSWKDIALYKKYEKATWEEVLKYRRRVYGK